MQVRPYRGDQRKHQIIHYLGMALLDYDDRSKTDIIGITCQFGSAKKIERWEVEEILKRPLGEILDLHRDKYTGK